MGRYEILPHLLALARGVCPLTRPRQVRLSRRDLAFGGVCWTRYSRENTNARDRGHPIRANMFLADLRWRA